MADEDRPSVDELKDRISSMTSVDALEDLKRGEDRKTALEAIDDRIAQIQEAGSEAELADDDGSVFSREELLAGAAGFGTTAEGMAGAMALAGTDSMTRTEAAEALRAYNEREV